MNIDVLVASLPVISFLVAVSGIPRRTIAAIKRAYARHTLLVNGVCPYHNRKMYYNGRDNQYCSSCEGERELRIEKQKADRISKAKKVIGIE